MSHTPTPWKVRNATDIFSELGADSGDGCVAASNDGWQIADCSVGLTSTADGLVHLSNDVKRANAAHIVKCVNEHDELVAALEWAMSIHEQLEDAGFVIYDPHTPKHLREIDKARTILARVKS